MLAGRRDWQGPSVMSLFNVVEPLRVKEPCVSACAMLMNLQHETNETFSSLTASSQDILSEVEGSYHKNAQNSSFCRIESGADFNFLTNG